MKQETQNLNKYASKRGIKYTNIYQRNKQKFFANDAFANLVLVTLIAITLSLCIFLYIIHKNIHIAISGTTNTSVINVFLKDSSSENQKLLAKKLKNNNLIQRIEFVSKNKAFELIKNENRLKNAIELLDENPLPNSFIITPLEKISTADFSNLLESLENLSEIDFVKHESDFFNKIVNIYNLFNDLFYFFCFAIFFMLIFLLKTSINEQINNKKQEIKLLKILGANFFYIAWPFLYKGIKLTFQSLIFTFIIIFFVFLLVKIELNNLFVLFQNLTFHFLNIQEILILISFVFIFATIGIFLSLKNIYQN